MRQEMAISGGLPFIISAVSNPTRWSNHNNGKQEASGPTTKVLQWVRQSFEAQLPSTGTCFFSHHDTKEQGMVVSATGDIVRRERKDFAWYRYVSTAPRRHFWADSPLA